MYKRKVIAIGDVIPSQNPNRFCLLGALLGNHILPAKELRPFHLRLAPEMKDSKLKDVFDRVIRSVVNYIRALDKVPLQNMGYIM